MEEICARLYLVIPASPKIPYLYSFMANTANTIKLPLCVYCFTEKVNSAQLVVVLEKLNPYKNASQMILSRRLSQSDLR